MNKRDSKHKSEILLILVEVEPVRLCLSLLKNSMKLAIPLVIVASLLVSTFAPLQSAMAAKKLTPTEGAELHNLQNVVGQCVQGAMRNRIYVALDNASGATDPSDYGGSGGDTGRNGSKFEWYASTKSNHTIQPGNQELTCASATQKLMTTLGYTSGASFLKDIGFTFNKDGAYWQSPNNQGSERRKNLNAANNKKVSGWTVPVGSSTYINALNAFQGGSCKAQQEVSWTSATPAQRNLVDTISDGRTYIKLKVAAGSSTSEYIYSYDAGGAAPAVGPGATPTQIDTKGFFWKVTQANGLNNLAAEESYTCTELASKISKNAAEMAKWNELNPANAPDQATSLNEDTASSDDEDATTSCAINGVGWLVCPVINFLAEIADGAYDFLADNFLAVEPAMFKSDGPLFVAWQVFQNIANAILVIAFLVIVFSQLTSYGISNYGIKKMLPNLIVVAIAINLSFIISTLAVDFSNILGYGLKDLFSSAVPELGAIGDFNPDYRPSSAATGDGVAGAIGWTTIAAGVLGAGAVVGATGGSAAIMMGLVALIPVLVTALTSLIVIFFILMGRQVLVVLLVVLAPVAFAAKLLPNTSKWLSKWAKIFISLLMVFPLIGLVYGASALASRIMSSIFFENPDTDNWMGQIIASGAMVIPLLVVPSLLKKSMNSIGDISGAVGKLTSGVSKGITGKVDNSGLNKHLGREAALRRAQIGSGSYQGKNPIARARSNTAARRNQAGWYNAVTSDYGSTLQNKGASLLAAQDKESVEEAGNWLNGFSYDNGQGGTAGLSANQKFDLAMGRNVTDTKGNVLIQSSGVSSAQRRAAMGQVAPIMTAGQAMELASASSSMNDASMRRSASQAISQVSSKAGFLGGKSLGDIEAGTYNQEAAIADWANNRMSGESLASMDKDAMQAVADAAVGNSSVANAVQSTIADVNNNQELSSKLTQAQSRQLDDMGRRVSATAGVRPPVDTGMNVPHGPATSMRDKPPGN